MIIGKKIFCDNNPPKLLVLMCLIPKKIGCVFKTMYDSLYFSCQSVKTPDNKINHAIVAFCVMAEIFMLPFPTFVEA